MRPWGQEWRRNWFLKTHKLFGLTTISKPFGLLVLCILMLSLFVGLTTSTASASIITTDYQITSDSASQERPDIYEYGPYDYGVVWQDNRNGNFDIYMYTSGPNSLEPEIQVTTNSGNDQYPKIYNDTIVYQSDRNGNWDIYIYNITSKIETQITNSVGNEEYPDIDGNHIVWQDSRNGGWDVYMYDLATQTEKAIDTYYENWSPAVSGDRILYTHDTYTGVHNYRITSYGISSDIHVSFDELIGRNPQLEIGWPTISGNLGAWIRDSFINSPYNFSPQHDIVMMNLNTGEIWQINTSADEFNLSVYDSYGQYLAFERYEVGKLTHIYVYSMTSKNDFLVTSLSSSQIHPVISSEYSNYVVYMDDRNGNWDIYLTIFGYGVGATGPNSQSTSSTPSANAAGSGNQDLMIIAIVAVVAVAAITAAVFVATRRKKPKKQELLHAPQSP